MAAMRTYEKFLRTVQFEPGSTSTVTTDQCILCKEMKHSSFVGEVSFLNGPKDMIISCPLWLKQDLPDGREGINDYVCEPCFNANMLLPTEDVMEKVFQLVVRRLQWEDEEWGEKDD